MVRPQTPTTRRKLLGAWATPPDLVDRVVRGVVTADWVARRPDPSTPVRVLDPACGDGRFLRAARRRLTELGQDDVLLTGADVDPAALDAARHDAHLTAATWIEGDALSHVWGAQRFDLVLGNPPYLSQLAAATTRGGASRRGGGPYADTAAEFLTLAIDLAEPDAGRVGLVLPQSVLASRDAGPIRAEVGRRAEMCWSWWSPERHFDADVVVCALGFERTARPGPATSSECATTWSHVVVRALGIPDLPALRTSGVVGDRADANANFRDEYYGLVPAVSDRGDGPPLVTTGVIEPGRCEWGRRPVRFAKRRFVAPRVELDRLDARMRRWAERKLVPKVLVASQMTVIEAVVDANGAWLPGVPVTSVVPHDGVDPWAIGAVLTSPVATVAVWHRLAGTGLSARSVRIGPSGVLDVPWPDGSLDTAIDALQAGDPTTCGLEVTRAFGVSLDHPIVPWWADRISRGRRAADDPERPTPDGRDPATR